MLIGKIQKGWASSWQEAARVTEEWDLGELYFCSHIHLQKFQTHETGIGCLHGSEKQNKEPEVEGPEAIFISI